MSTTLNLDVIQINGGTQCRAALSDETVAEYAEEVRAGGTLPPVTVFFDGSTHWLADGFHRFHAHRSAGETTITADVRTGTQRDAILFAAGANAAHGLRRTNADKRKAVEVLLADPEWSQWSDREIGRRCEVHHATVAAIRKTYLDNYPDSEATRIVQRGGTEYAQKVTNIGRSERAKAQPEEPDAQPEEAAVQPEEQTAMPERPAKADPKDAEIARLKEELSNLTDLSADMAFDLEAYMAVEKGEEHQKIAMQAAHIVNVERARNVAMRERDEAVKDVRYWRKRAEKADLKDAGQERIEELEAQVNELAANLEGAMEDIESMTRVLDAGDKLEAALAEAKRYRELSRVLQERVNGLMGEKNAAMAAAKRWKNKWDRLERASGIRTTDEF